MSKALRILKNLLLGILLLLVLAIVIIYIWSEIKLNRTYDLDIPPFDMAKYQPNIEEGKRLSYIIGCSGCHDLEMQGQVLWDVPNVLTMVAPNLMDIAKSSSDSDFEKMIRHGIRKDGSSVIMGMPSEFFRHLKDQDLANIIAYIRNKPYVDPPVQKTSYKLLGRLGLIIGEIKNSRESLAEMEFRSEENSLAKISDDSLTDQLKMGKYLTQIACTECHGFNLQGNEMTVSPDLMIAYGYSPEDWQKLMTTGKGLGDRDLGLMSKMVKYRFSHFTDEEREAVYLFLRYWAETRM